MTATFTITNPELEAIRSVERYMAVQLHNGHQPPQPVENDLNTLSGLLERLATAPPVEEVASRPDGEPTTEETIKYLDLHVALGEMKRIKRGAMNIEQLNRRRELINSSARDVSGETEWINGCIAALEGQPPETTVNDILQVNSSIAINEAMHPLGQAGPIGIVRNHPSHDEDLSTEHLIIWSLLPLANLPNTVANLVKDAVHGHTDEQCRAALAAVDAIARLRREPDAEIPF